MEKKVYRMVAEIYVEATNMYRAYQELEQKLDDFDTVVDVFDVQEVEEPKC